MSTIEQNVIVTGIINLDTGEITNTSCAPKDKLINRLKVRDELGCSHAVGDFMSIEFGMTDRLPYYIENMRNQDEETLRPLRMLSAKYYIYVTTNRLAASQARLDEVHEVNARCLSLYDSKTDYNKHEYLSGLLDEGLAEAKEEVMYSKEALAYCKDKLQKLMA